MKTLSVTGLIGLLGLLLIAPAVHAGQMNKCVDVNGNLMLTDEPCSMVKPKPPQGTPPKQAAPDKLSNKPLPPILPPAEQQIRPAPPPAPAEKPAQ